MISSSRIPSILFAFATALAVASCGEESTVPPDGDAMHITLPQDELTLLSGTSGTVPVTVVRNAFNGIITLRAEGVPSGVNVPEVIVHENEEQATLVFTATSGAAPGTSEVSIRAEGDSVTTSIRILHLQIRPPGSFSISSEPVGILPGSNSSTTLTINRIGGFTGTVALQLSSVPGLVAAVQPAELSGGASTALITVAADRTIRPGAYFLRVTASSPGFADEHFDITVTVSGT